MLGDTIAKKQIASYRPDIDGLRAIAIILVVIYHAFPKVFPGGFVGVDVFFVISGYLISNIIYQQHLEGRFNFLMFYRNRFKRLFPSLICVLFSLYFLCIFIFFPDELSLLGKHINFAIIFTSNLRLYYESSLPDDAGYFAPTFEQKPLMHLWSLGIEEQFYILFPIIFYFLFIGKRKHIAQYIILFTALSFACNIYYSYIRCHSPSAYFLPQARCWEILSGCLLMLVMRAKGSIALCAGKPKLLDAVSVVGLTFALAGSFVARQHDYPGYQALLPVLGACLLIYAGGSALVNKILAWKPLVFVGLVSYPWYLWHWPLLSLDSILNPGSSGMELRIMLIGASFVLAVATYFFVERNIRLTPTPLKLRLLALSAIVLLVLGYAATTKRFQQSFANANLPPAARDWHPFDDGFTQVAQNGRQVSEIPGEKYTMFLGDSHMAQYAPRISKVLLSSGLQKRGAVVVESGACLPVPGFVNKGRLRCSETMDAFRKLSKSDRQVDTVVIAACWFNYFSDSSGLMSIDSSDPMSIDGIPLQSAEGKERVYRNLAALVREQQSLGRRVVLVSNIPVGKSFDPKSFTQRHLLHSGISFAAPAPFSRDAFLTTNAEVYGWLKDLAVETGAEFIDPTSYLCPDDTCMNSDESGTPLYTDGGHLRSWYVREHIHFLDGVIMGR